MALASEYSLPTTIPAEAPDTAASLKLPLPPLAGRDSGCRCSVPGVRGLRKKNSPRGNQPTNDQRISKTPPPSVPPSAVPEKSRVTGIFCFFSEPPSPVYYLRNQAKKKRAQSIQVPPFRKKKKKKQGWLLERLAEYHHSEMVSLEGLCVLVEASQCCYASYSVRGV